MQMLLTLFKFFLSRLLVSTFSFTFERFCIIYADRHAALPSGTVQCIMIVGGIKVNVKASIVSHCFDGGQKRSYPAGRIIKDTIRRFSVISVDIAWTMDNLEKT